MGTDATATRPTLARVAARAGVSASTASLAFADDARVAAATRERVLAAAAELGYAGPDPRARSLRRGRSGVVGVVLEDRLQDFFRDPVNVAMLDGLADEVGADGDSLLLITDTIEQPADLGSAVMDAAVVMGCSARMLHEFDLLRQRRLPVIGVEVPEIAGIVAIDLDNRIASETIGRMLAELGHEEVAAITLPLEPERRRGPVTDVRVAASDAFVALERLAGLRRSFPGAGGEVAAHSSVEEGAAAARALLAGPDRPTAIVAQSDLLAAGALRCADELGIRVPAELSIVGFDGVRIDALGARALTTMVQPALDKGRAAGRAVRAAVAGAPPEPAALRCELRLGDTTGPAPR